VSSRDRSHRWVADASSARGAARAFLGPVLARPRIWVFAVLVELALAVLLADSVGSFGLGLLVALVPTALVIGVMLGTSYLRSRREFGRRFASGIQLASTFGRDQVVIRGAGGQATLAYSDVAALVVVGDWVLIRRAGAATVDVWPHALFPDDELARVRRAVDAAQPR
jgi:hypothetical protein